LGAVAKWCAALGIEAVGYRDIQRLWLSHGSTKDFDCVGERNRIPMRLSRIR
jgi:hypothetical protein